MRVVRGNVLPVAITLMCLAFGIWAYPRMAERVPTHWNFRGEVDGYSGKTFAVFFFPALTLALYALFLYLPEIDPRKASYKQFEGTYRLITTAIIMFMNGIYLIIIMAGLGYLLNVGVLVRLGISLIVLLIGDQLTKVRPNWFLGIRTPWTLSDEENWRKTHQFGSKTMVLGAILSLATLPFHVPLAAVMHIGLIMAAALMPVLYSYILFRKSHNGPSKT
ncbi:MAG TPA: DUF1648 domain-containing protein [Firmicutes bacterium]|nr:DUF1648 domain-containing protein [Bacillota bacterium]